MNNSMDMMFDNILEALQVAEKRHRAVRDHASDNCDWGIYDSEDKLISKIITWRRSLEPIRSEILESGAVSDVDTKSLSNKTPIEGKLIFRSIVGWSTLNYGITIPALSRDLFFRAIGQTVAAGASCRISIEFADAQRKPFKASVIHAVNGSAKVLQIRYAKESHIASELRRFFKSTYDYCNNQRLKYGENIRISIPVDLEEIINVYATDSPRLLRFVFESNERQENKEHLSSEFDSEDTRESEVIESDIRVGRYIRKKLRKLCDSGFEFSTEQIENLCDWQWSKETFKYNYNLPFAKLINEENEISELATDKNGYNRYWREIFSFGSFNLLFISQWYSKDRVLFDKWYNQLHPAHEETIEIDDNPAYKDDTTIYEDDDYEGEKVLTSQTKRLRPTSFMLLEQEYGVKSWTDLFIKVCEILLLHHPYEIATLDRDSILNTSRRINFSYVESEIKYSGKRLSNGLYIETNQSSGGLLSSCHKLLRKCGYLPEDLKIETVEV